MKNCFLFLLVVPVVVFGQGYHSDVLTTIMDRASETHSDALLIYQDGQLICEDYFGKKEKPIYLASAAKSLVSMAIGQLLDEGRIDSLDQAVYTFFPEWKQGRKKDITVRMLLNHTSGLQDLPNASIELEPAPDWQVEDVIKLALAAELQSKPGQHVFYSNKAVALLGGLIEKASGKRMDHYFEDHFFRPMDITQFDWVKDKAGHPTAHGAFLLQPSDFIKFGITMLQNGIYKGKRILSESWVQASTQQPGTELDPIWGFLWWRLMERQKRVIDQEVIEEWRNAGVDADFIKQLLPIKDNIFESPKAFFEGLEQILGQDWRKKMSANLPHFVRYSKRLLPESQIGYYAEGFRGNYMVVIPAHKIVAVRCADPIGFNYETDFFQDFVQLVLQLGRQ